MSEEDLPGRYGLTFSDIEEENEDNLDISNSSTMEADDMYNGVQQQLDGNDSPPENTTGGNASEPPGESDDLLFTEPNYESEPNPPTQSQLSVLGGPNDGKSYVDAFSWALFNSSSSSDSEPHHHKEKDKSDDSEQATVVDMPQVSDDEGDNSNEGDVDTTWYEMSGSNNNDSPQITPTKSTFQSQTGQVVGNNNNNEDEDGKGCGKMACTKFGFINRDGVDPFDNPVPGTSGVRKRKRAPSNAFESVDMFADTGRTNTFTQGDEGNEDQDEDQDTGNSETMPDPEDVVADSSAFPSTADDTEKQMPSSSKIRKPTLVKKKITYGRGMGPQYYSSTDEADESCIPGFVAEREARERADRDPDKINRRPAFRGTEPRDPVSFYKISI